MKHEKNEQMMDMLNECVRACNHCAVACLGEKEVNMLSRCIRLDLDCAEICRVAAGLLERDSENADAVLSVCAVICNSCADECEKHSHMEHCRVCAEVCRACAESCQQMEHV